MLEMIEYREYPKDKMFKLEYRYNSYELNDHLDDFVYYEETPIKEIQFDDRHLLSWGYFTTEGLNYLLPRLLESIIEDLKSLSVTQEDFLINLTHDNNIINLLLNLKKDELCFIRDMIENILFNQDEYIVNSIGEHYLFLDLEFINKLIKDNLDEEND